MMKVFAGHQRTKRVIGMDVSSSESLERAVYRHGFSKMDLIRTLFCYAESINVAYRMNKKQFNAAWWLLLGTNMIWAIVVFGVAR